MAASTKQGLAEYVVVVAMLSIAAAAALGAFHEPIRAFFGNAPAQTARAAVKPMPPSTR